MPDTRLGWLLRSAPSRRSDTRNARWYILALVLLLIVVGGPRFAVEAPFFRPNTLMGAGGTAPVPQDDPGSPAVDRAFEAAAAFLPREVVCVISQDSWNRDYFRASYLLMPRRVWPVAPLLVVGTPSTRELARAARERHATCLLVSENLAAPAGWRRATEGVYALYLRDGRP